MAKFLVMKYSRRKTFATRFITLYNLEDDETAKNKHQREQKKDSLEEAKGKSGRGGSEKSTWPMFVCLFDFFFNVYFLPIFFFILLLYPVYVAYDEHVYWLRGIS